MSHYEDEAQVEQLRRWWRENWMALAGGLVIGLAGIFGWQWWQERATTHSEQASRVYEDLRKTEADKVERQAELGKNLRDDFGDTPYAAHGALLLAQRAAERSDWDAARENLDWVVKKADDPGLKKVAKLRLARVLWQQQKADDALALLDVPEDDAFAALYQELRGDIQRGKGDAAAARAAYEKAMQIGPTPAGRQQLQRKLDDLATEAPKPDAAKPDAPKPGAAQPEAPEAAEKS
jgi:predicted negative regulator of RcsB-dependent stress response